MGLTCTTALLALSLVVRAAAEPGSPGTGPERTIKLLRVFLADFDDVPRPATYTTDYFHKLFFGLGEPRETPEGRAIGGSVREYFLEVSNGTLDVAGEVSDWVRIHRNITKVPHWKRGMKPFGESWPIIVAETLRAHGLVGEGAKEKLRLSDGRMPELLVFLNTDWGVGGCNRSWGHLKTVLGKVKEPELWDEAWAGFPGPLSSYSATIWRKAGRSKQDGTIDKIPPADELELFPLSIMMHEMGHQLAGLPDLYGPAFQPWGVFDLMGGPAASTHFPMTVAAYLRERRGWMHYTDLPRQTARDLALWPLETHKQAFRLPQGLGQEQLVIENRQRLEYPRDYGNPPVDKGPRLLVYRVDPVGRKRVMSGDSAIRKITTMVRRPGPYGEVWGEPDPGDITRDTTPSSRNSLGELWWEFRNMRPGTGGEMRFDAELAVTDLLQVFHKATWTGGDGTPIEPGRFGRAGGCVAIRPVGEGDADDASRVLYVQAPPRGSVIGRFGLPFPDASRLYLSFAGRGAGTMAVRADDATVASVPLASESATQVVVADVPVGADELALVLSSQGDGGAQLDLAEAWLAPMVEPTLDFLGLIETFRWEQEPSDQDAKPSVATTQQLHDGFWYGPQVLTLPLGGGGPRRWCGTHLFTVPEGKRVLRALIGLGHDAPAGTKVRVSLTIVRGEREQKLIGGLTVEIHAPGGSGSRTNALAVVEATLPEWAVGREAILLVEATTDSEQPFTLAMPCLRIE